MEPNQTHAPSAAALIPGFVGGGNQILFVQPRPDVLLSGQLEVIEFQFNPWRAISRSGLTFASRRSSSG